MVLNKMAKAIINDSFLQRYYQIPYICNYVAFINLIIMIRSKGLRFAYDDEKKFSYPDIELDDGETLFVFGDSGSGKTTLLFLLAGLLKPASGEVLVNETNISVLTTRQTDRFRGCNIGFVFQKPHFIRSLSLLQNLELIKYLAGQKIEKRKLLDILDRLGISENANTSPMKLSGGEQQRAMIAMAVCNKPSLILVDEPTSNLDDKNCDIVISLLKEQANLNNSTLVIVSHDHRLAKIADNHFEL